MGLPQLGLPKQCFSLHPGKRLNATQAYTKSLSQKDKTILQRKIRQLAFPHCAYAIPAWGLIVLPGPGSESDPTERYYDWTPGIGQASIHFAEFPLYVAGQLPPDRLRKRGMWQKMRKYISACRLPGVKPENRLACWGLVNLTEEHARSEAVRHIRPTLWDLGSLEAVINVCKPAMIIAPPSKIGRGKCHERVQLLLKERGAHPTGQTRQYQGDRSGKTWDFDWWKTPWGRCRVGKMHTQPSYWGHRVADILTEEAQLVARHL